MVQLIIGKVEVPAATTSYTISLTTLGLSSSSNYQHVALCYQAFAGGSVQMVPTCYTDDADLHVVFANATSGVTDVHVLVMEMAGSPPSYVDSNSGTLTCAPV